MGGAGGTDPGGAGGDAGAAGAGGAHTCAGASMTQTATTSANSHNHITNQGETNLTALINSSNPTVTFQLPLESSHSHTIQLTQGEVDALLAGNPITGKVSSSTGNHVHTYTISCG